MLQYRKGQGLTFTYKNWRGEIAERNVLVDFVYFGSTEFHPEPQWLMRAKDLDKGEWRDFAMKDMSNVRHTDPYFDKH